MSAFVLSDQEISKIVAYGLHDTIYCNAAHIFFTNETGLHYLLMVSSPERAPMFGDAEFRTASEVGRILLTQNIRSVVHRYQGADSDEMQAYADRIAAYEFPGPSDRPILDVGTAEAEAIQACNNYSYQASEPGDLDETEAGQWIRAIHDKAAQVLATHYLDQHGE